MITKTYRRQFCKRELFGMVTSRDPLKWAKLTSNDQGWEGHLLITWYIYIYISGWWFQWFFIFTPIPGRMIQFDYWVWYFSIGLKPPIRYDLVLYDWLCCSSLATACWYIIVLAVLIVVFNCQGSQTCWRCTLVHIAAWLSSKRIDVERTHFTHITTTYGIFTYICRTWQGNIPYISIHYIDPMGSIFVLSSAWPVTIQPPPRGVSHDHKQPRWRFAPSRLMQTLFKSIRPLGSPWSWKRIGGPGKWTAGTNLRKWPKFMQKSFEPNLRYCVPC